MKKTLLALLKALAAFFLMSAVCFGQTVTTTVTPVPSNPGNKIIEWYGERPTTAANDTFYIPDTSGAAGWDLGPYSMFSFDFEVTSLDSNIADSVYVRLYTQWEKDMSQVIDSATLTYAFDSSANDANWSSKRRWFAVADSTNDYPYWHRYAFAEVVVKTAGLSGTTYIDTTDRKAPEG